MLLHPFRGFATWGFQHGYLPQSVRRVLPWRWVYEPFTIYWGGLTCRWFPSEVDVVGPRIFWTGFREWEKDTAPVIFENIRNSRCFLDVGANCGIYTVMGCKINPSVRVVAVEPVPPIYAALARNVSMNHLDSRVTILNIALGDQEGIVPFHEAENPSMGSLAVEGYQGQRGRIIDVRCRTLDSVVEELGIEPDFMKIDVEGFEHLVLRGGERVLSKFRPRIVLEVNPGDTGELVTEILSKHGYRFQNITAAGPETRNQIVPVAECRDWLCTPMN